MSGIVLNPYRHGVAAPGAFLVDAVSFNGSSRFARGAMLTGAANSKLWTFCVWFRDSAFKLTDVIFSGASPGQPAGGTNQNSAKLLQFSGTANLQVRGYGTDSVQHFGANSSGTLALNTWHCIMCSVDMTSSSRRHLFRGDSNIYVAVSYTDANLFFESNDFCVGASPTGGAGITADIAELWYAPGRYIDFSVEANRRKFFSSTGKPVFLGTDGSLPTGASPLVYLHLDNGEAVANFGTNRGTGGNLVSFGAPAIAATSPSD